LDRFSFFGKDEPCRRPPPRARRCLRTKVLRGALETVNLVVIKTHLSHGFRDPHDNRTPHAGAGLGRGRGSPSERG
jgi:hypothetical protein